MDTAVVPPVAAAAPPPPPVPVHRTMSARMAVPDFEGAVQIISVNETGEVFELHDARVRHILARVPPDLKVAVVSVVGAFRTGKSFLLDLMLRYLRYYDENPTARAGEGETAWMTGEKLEGGSNSVEQPALLFSTVPEASTTAKTIAEMQERATTVVSASSNGAAAGNEGVAASSGSSGGAAGAATGVARAAAAAAAAAGGGAGGAAAGGAAAASAAPASRAGFLWRAGDDRATTGIWMWSRPFIRTTPAGERVAVLLMDTQGLFDRKTSQRLTTCIFGLSTLISSYSIYNIKERIQEDAVQHLALFAEYSRKVQRDEAAEAEEGAASAAAAAGKAAAAAVVAAALPPSPVRSALDTLAAVAVVERSSGGGGGGGGGGRASVRRLPPFQRIELLVRDAELDDAVWRDAGALAADQTACVDSFLADNYNNDVRVVREVIRDSFQRITCVKLPHPGLAVRKPTFTGSLETVEDTFKVAVARYIHHLFNDDLFVKVVNGVDITAPQLQSYIQTYARLFQTNGAFPEPRLLVEATAEASNTNAKLMGLRHYREHMERVLGEGYQADDALVARSEALQGAALEIFGRIANFGSERLIAASRDELVAELRTAHEGYVVRNRDGNPLRNVELVVFALAIVLASWMLKFILDFSCAPFSNFCARGSQMFAFIASVTLLVTVGVMVWVGKSALVRFKAVAGALVNAAMAMGGSAGLASLTAAVANTAGAPAAAAAAASATATGIAPPHESSTIRHRATTVRLA